MKIGAPFSFPQNKMHLFIRLWECVDVWCRLLLFLSPLITPQSGAAAVILLQTPEGRGEGLILGRHWVNTNTTRSFIQFKCQSCVGLDYKVRTYIHMYSFKYTFRHHRYYTHLILLWNDQNRDFVNTETVGNSLLHTSTKILKCLTS